MKKGAPGRSRALLFCPLMGRGGLFAFTKTASFCRDPMVLRMVFCLRRVTFLAPKQSHHLRAKSLAALRNTSLYICCNLRY